MNVTKTSEKTKPVVPESIKNDQGDSQPTLLNEMQGISKTMTSLAENDENEISLSTDESDGDVEYEVSNDQDESVTQYLSGKPEATETN